MTPDEEELLRAFAGGQDVEVARCDVESVLTEIDRLRESEAALRDEVGVLELALKVRKDKALEERVDLTAERDVARAYLDEARAQLAALHAADVEYDSAYRAYTGAVAVSKLHDVGQRMMAATTRRKAAIADTEAAAREHDARIRAAALREVVAVQPGSQAVDYVWLDMLRTDHGIPAGAYSIAPALPVLRAAISDADLLAEVDRLRAEVQRVERERDEARDAHRMISAGARTAADEAGRLRAKLAELRQACLDATYDADHPRTTCRLCGRTTLHADGPVQHDSIWRWTPDGRLHERTCLIADPEVGQ